MIFLLGNWVTQRSTCRHTKVHTPTPLVPRSHAQCTANTPYNRRVYHLGRYLSHLCEPGHLTSDPPPHTHTHTHTHAPRMRTYTYTYIYTRAHTHTRARAVLHITPFSHMKLHTLSKVVHCGCGELATLYYHDDGDQCHGHAERVTPVPGRGIVAWRGTVRAWQETQPAQLFHKVN